MHEFFGSILVVCDLVPCVSCFCVVNVRHLYPPFYANARRPSVRRYSFIIFLNSAWLILFASTMSSLDGVPASNRYVGLNTNCWLADSLLLPFPDCFCPVNALTVSPITLDRFSNCGASSVLDPAFITGCASDSLAAF